VTRTKQVGNPEFSFLSGGEGEDYYNWLKYATKQGINPDAPPGRGVLETKHSTDVESSTSL